MPRVSPKADDLATMTARRATLLSELAELEGQVRAAEEAAKDAGRSTLQAALGRIKIAAMDKADAKAIAVSIGQHGGKIVAGHLSTLRPS